MSRFGEQRAADHLARLRLQAQSGGLTSLPGDLALEELEERERCESSFYEFVKRAWREVDPAPFIEAWHMRVICDTLQDAHEHGQNILILCPPGVGKSLLASVLYPCWTWARDPSERFLCSSHSMTISVRDTRRARDVLRSPWYARLWPNVRLLPDQDQKTRYQNRAGGWRIATSTGSGVTGERAGLILLDDPVDLRAMFYDDQIGLAVDHFRTALRSRGSGDRTRYIGIMQRVAADDFASALIDESERGGLQWDVLRLPMRYEATSEANASPRDERRPGGTHDGETLLFPAVFGEEEVSRLEVSYAWRAQAILQQAPSRETGAVFKAAWIRDYLQIDRGARLDYLLEAPGGAFKKFSQSECATFCTVDLATSLSASADYTVFAAWALTPDRDLLLLDLIRDRISGEKQLPLLREFYWKWKPQKVAIESVAYQLSFIQRAAADGLPVEPIKRSSGEHKELRAAPLAQLMSEGRFYVLAARDGVPPPWRDDYLAELLAFPSARHDDVVDVSADAAREATLGSYWLGGFDYQDAYDPGVAAYSAGLPFGPGESQFVDPDPDERSAYSPLGSFTERYGGDAM